MLNRFLSLYATLNLYTRLVIVSQPSGQRLAWPDSKGQGAPF
jgi:type VI secretion system protein ImpG